MSVLRSKALDEHSLIVSSKYRLTSSNYDDDQKKLTGGRNGYGAKLANIYSLEFGKYRRVIAGEADADRIEAQ